MSTQHPTSPPKLCSDTSTAKNSSYCFNKQASLDENVDGKILQILDDLLNLFDESGKASQGIKDHVNECFQNIHITSESRLTGQFSSKTIFNLSHRVLTDAEIKILEKGLDFATQQRKINEWFWVRVQLQSLNTNSFEITKQDLLIPIYVWKNEEL